MGSNKIKEFEHNDMEEKNVINSIIGIKRKHIGLGSVMRQELVDELHKPMRKNFPKRKNKSLKAKDLLFCNILRQF